MTVRSQVPLEKRIPPGAALLIDTSVVLAYLVGTEQISLAATQLFDAFVATGRNPASISTVTCAEILVRPFQHGPSAVATAEGFLRHFDALGLADIDYDTAREAARIRATTGLRMPDALIVATAVVRASDILCTVDRAQASAAESVGVRAVVFGGP